MLEAIITGIVAIGLSGGFLTWIRLVVKGYKNWKKDKEVYSDIGYPPTQTMIDYEARTKLTSRGRTHVL